ncbi:hypothetical protein C8R44DRAFT_751427 [Mycena epipterygia]|nr:hypothetical protein C8R44DRAFT_751411 [Mycena epipterygia]KAJ7089417.1 hypothetical protein C8R44DRAFT_751427 [Mycena epipterygia]
MHHQPCSDEHTVSPCILIEINSTQMNVERICTPKTSTCMHSVRCGFKDLNVPVMSSRSNTSGPRADPIQLRFYYTSISYQALEFGHGRKGKKTGVKKGSQNEGRAEDEQARTIFFVSARRRGPRLGWGEPRFEYGESIEWGVGEESQSKPCERGARMEWGVGREELEQGDNGEHPTFPISCQSGRTGPTDREEHPIASPIIGE